MTPMNEPGRPENPPPLSPRSRRNHWILFTTLAVGLAALDLWSKQAVFALLGARIEPIPALPERNHVVADRVIDIIPGFFELEANINYGAFSGWFSSHTGVLTVLSLAALAILGGFFWSHLRRPGPHPSWFTAALGLLWGGTCGNLYDRATHGYVRDFIKWFFVWQGKPHVWPNFNIADSAICVGVGILLVVTVFVGRGKAPAPIPR